MKENLPSPIVNFAAFAGKLVDPFAIQHVLKQADVEYQYLIGKEWTNALPATRPNGKRAVFFDIESFRKAREAYFAWCSLSSIRGKERPVYPEKVIERLINVACSDSSLIIFTPWGFRPQGEFGQKEIEAMDKIDQTTLLIRQRRIKPQVVLMPADIYATEINHLDPNHVDVYFAQVREQAKKRSYQIIPWSQIRAENLDRYVTLARKFTDERIETTLPSFVIDSAIGAAAKREQTKDGAYAYLRERLCEATIIERLFQPIKFSLVAKNKDEGVDLELPRIYCLPENLQFPWL